jgi:hypothetical protein
MTGRRITLSGAGKLWPYMLMVEWCLSCSAFHRQLSSLRPKATDAFNFPASTASLLLKNGVEELPSPNEVKSIGLLTISTITSSTSLTPTCNDVTPAGMLGYGL